MYPSARKWLQISLFNLMLVASIGVILRYKIAFSLPFIDQKYLLNGHSHFAFAGWITQALMALLVACLSEQSGGNLFHRYRWLLIANLITAYGMLLTFPFVGYAFPSIVFSTLSIFVSYAFSIIYWKDLKKIATNNPANSWFKVALLCNVASSAGAFSLAYMMATKNVHQNFYLAAVYFFLHFQYNGWFFFSCMGLLIYRLYGYGIRGNTFKKVFILFAGSVVPAYFLSVLWGPIPSWLYVLVVIAAIAQLVGWIFLLRFIQRNLKEIRKHPTGLSGFLFILSGIALTIKLCLQAGSVIPSLSKLAYGFRPIVIGYLHLEMLAVISLFIITYSFAHKLVRINKLSTTGIILFIVGIFLNEILLMIQGVADIQYVGVPFIDFYLFGVAILLFGGILIVNFGQFFYKASQAHKTFDFGPQVL
jgi:hypothetical protein